MKAVKSNNRRTSSSSFGAAAMVPAAGGGGGGGNSNDHRRQTKARAPPSSPPTTVELRGVPIHFPFQPYACQRDYMETVLDALFRSENALLESPTGTGKTLCLLCATLAWQREEARKLYQSKPTINEVPIPGKPPPPRRVPTIIYASRTHSQLSQVVRELRNTRYRPKHAVLGSREQMCVNPKVKRAGSTGADINHDCNRLGQDRSCQFRNKLEGFTAPNHETSATGTQPVLDMEDLVSMGQTHRVCPFYYTRSLVEDAELILVPYNYLFDRDSRTSTLADVPWKNAVVIFDEAHNLEAFASESASFDLTTSDIGGCLTEIQRAVNYVQTFGSTEEGSGKLRPENIAKLKTIFLRLEEYIMNSLSTQTMAYKGEFMMELFQKGAGINHANHELFIAEVRKLTDVFLQFGGSSGGKGGGGTSSRGGAPRLEHFVQCVKRVFGETSEARCYAKAQSYRVHITQKQAQPSSGSSSRNNDKNNNNRVAGRTVSYWCFAPSEAMRELANLEVRSILVTSGTLSPLESYALELDLPFPHRLENPHIIPEDQIHVRVIGKGVSNKILSSSYERRQDDEYYTELGNTLISLGKIIPGGMLVFFPSYGVMDMCLERWGGPASGVNNKSQGNVTTSFFAARKKQVTGSARYSFPFSPHTFSSTKEQMTPWKRFLGVKAVVVEPKSTVDLADAINEFHKYLNMPKSKGVALFGVCRGKISEGIDFAHDMCRAVVITGLPFPPSFDPKVKMKREFLDQNRSAQNQKASRDGGFAGQESASQSLSGHDWYTQQAHRAVNQAVGRVIRNKNDYGAVLLLDNRFSLPANQQGLSKWVRPHLLPDEGMGRTIGALSRFYKEAAKKAEERERVTAAPPSNPVSIILKYEEEEGKENQSNGDDDFENANEVTRIAYVENVNSHGIGIATDDEGTSFIRPDRIIERVELADESHLKFSSTNIGKEGLRCAEPLDSQSSVSASLPPKESAKSSNPSKQGEKPNYSPAQRFFHIVQERMTQEELSKMKHAAVAMKPLKDGKLGPNFVSAAREMVKIILSYESFEERSREDKPEMIDLLLALMPKNIVHHVQNLTLGLVFDSSSFAKYAQERTEKEDYRRFRSAFKALLQKVWFKPAGGNYIAPQDYLLELQRIVMPFLELDLLTSREGIVEKLLKMFPTEIRAVTVAFFEQLEASTRISKLKAKEKTCVGEDSIHASRFRSLPVFREQQAFDVVSEDVSTIRVAPGDEKQSSSIEGPSSKIIAERNGKRQNPYMRQPSTTERQVKSAKTDNTISKEVGNQRSALLASLAGKCWGSGQNPHDPVKKALNDLESDIFSGKMRITTRTIESNAPKDWQCELCASRCAKPIIAPCSHVACIKCWADWLKKKETCPACRNRTTWASLALVVFKQKIGTILDP